MRLPPPMCAQRHLPLGSSLATKKSMPPADLIVVSPNFASSVASPTRKTLPSLSMLMQRVLSFFRPPAEKAHSNVGGASGGAALRDVARGARRQKAAERDRARLDIGG